MHSPVAGLAFGKLIWPGRAPHADAERPLDWPGIFRRLALAYGWTPQQVGRMTLEQVALAGNRSVAAGQRLLLPPERAREVSRRRREQRAAGACQTDDWRQEAATLRALLRLDDLEVENNWPSRPGRRAARNWPHGDRREPSSAASDSFAIEQRQLELLGQMSEQLRAIRASHDAASWQRAELHGELGI